jgi:hypothetical protein
VKEGNGAVEAAPAYTMSNRDEFISSRDYARLCELVYAEAGIRLGTEKKIMLEARIRRRLKALELHSYGQYCDYLFGRQGRKEEIVHFIDVVTTNKTDFFREPRHFDFLVDRALPEVSRNESGRPFLIWSAGCSTGEEPYTMAIVLSEYAQSHPGFRFRILASDISTVVLGKAELGVYTSDVVAPVAVDRVSPPELHGCRLRHRREGRRDLLPQCDHLLRPPHAGAHSLEAGQLSDAGRVYVCRPLGDPARYESAAGACGPGALQENRCRCLSPPCRRSTYSRENRTWSGNRRFCGRCWAPAWASLF